MVSNEASERVTEPPVAPPRLGKGSASESSVEELLEALAGEPVEREE